MVAKLTHRDKDFIVALPDDIKKGRTTDVYFLRTVKILKSEGLEKVRVYAEITVSSMPRSYRWAILGGLRDVIKLFRGLPVDLYAMPEGSVFYDKDYYGTREPILAISGEYASFAVYETPMLGFLAFGSGIVTKTARLRKIAGNRIKILSFGARRMHPAVSPFISFYAYIGGCDGVSCVLGAEFLGVKPMGTMPHSLIIIYRAIRGNHAEAWRAFHRVLPKDVPRIMLVDTFYDEKEEALMAVEALGPENIYGIRLDTPSSRRGRFEDIVREVKWELKLRGWEKVKIILSGGIDEESLSRLIEAGADGFGIGSTIANAPIIDVAMDIVAVERGGSWIPIAKRGKMAGLKQVYRCQKCLTDIVVEINEKVSQCPVCGGSMREMLLPYLRNGELVREIPSPHETREYVLDQLEKLDLNRKPWE
ncbi:MAG: nicotinate phosphoribosyltransferase [Thermoprotei archaeon]|nr:MAG: nicotinate phosphoribosyltransferase [Thermoprotei archaeon]